MSGAENRASKENAIRCFMEGWALFREAETESSARFGINQCVQNARFLKQAEHPLSDFIREKLQILNYDPETLELKTKP